MVLAIDSNVDSSEASVGSGRGPVQGSSEQWLCRLRALDSLPVSSSQGLLLTKGRRDFRTSSKIRKIRKIGAGLYWHQLCAVAPAV